MPADEALRTALLASPSITSIVGGYGVYIDDAGQADLSTYIIISQQGHDALGDLSETTGIGKTQIDVDCFGKTRAQARTLADAISSRLKDFTGTVGGVQIFAVNWVEEGSDKVTSQDGSAVHYYVLTEAFDVFWE